MNRIRFVPLALIALVLVPFLVRGDVLVDLATADRASGTVGAQGVHGGRVGIVPLVADPALRIFSTPVIAGLGILLRTASSGIRSPGRGSAKNAQPASASCTPPSVPTSSPGTAAACRHPTARPEGLRRGGTPADPA